MAKRGEGRFSEQYVYTITALLVNTEKINLFQKLLGYLSPEVKNVKPVLGDSMNVIFGDSMNVIFNDESFDVVIMNETISHVKEMENSIDEVYRVLKYGGTFLIRDGNNNRRIS